jgi:hypothetical protein
MKMKATTNCTYKSISKGVVIETKWETKQDDGKIYCEWYSGVVTKVHRYDTTGKYTVCCIFYDDGTKEKSAVLYEKDYGTIWRIKGNGTDSSPDRNNIDYINKYKSVHAKLDHITLCQHITIGMISALLYYLSGHKIKDDYVFLQGLIGDGLQTSLKYVTHYFGYELDNQDGILSM